MPDTTNPQADRYRRRPAEIEAVQWTGSNADALHAFAGPAFDEIAPEDRVEDPEATAQVSDFSDWKLLYPGDWVVRHGEDFERLSAEEFADLYEPAVPSAPADRAAILREAADRLWAMANRTTERGAGVLWAADWLRRTADAASGPGGVAGEAQQPETQAETEVSWQIQTQWHDGEWRVWSFRDEHADALSEFERVKDDKHAWRLMRFDTSVTVEAEHAPAAVSQPDGEA